MTDELCPICQRELGTIYDEHHLIPRTFKGKDVIRLHKICHNKLHATFTEREMLHVYHDVDIICQHPDIQSFIVWVRKKPIDFYVKTKDSTIRKGKRRR